MGWGCSAQAVEAVLMPLTREQLVKTHGEPVRAEPHIHPSRGIRKTVSQHRPGITEDYYLWFRCGAYAEKASFGGTYVLKQGCDEHKGIEGDDQA